MLVAVGVFCDSPKQYNGANNAAMVMMMVVGVLDREIQPSHNNRFRWRESGNLARI